MRAGGSGGQQPRPQFAIKSTIGPIRPTNPEWNAALAKSYKYGKKIKKYYREKRMYEKKGRKYSKKSKEEVFSIIRASKYRLKAQRAIQNALDCDAKMMEYVGKKKAIQLVLYPNILSMERKCATCDGIGDLISCASCDVLYCSIICEKINKWEHQFICE